MTKFKITKGSEKDFEGAPDWAVCVTKGISGNTYWEEDSRRVNGNRWQQMATAVKGKYDVGSELPFTKIIAQREPIPYSESWPQWHGGVYRAEETEEAPAWNGEGLPPIGVECEWRDEHGRYNAGKVVYSSEWVIVFRDGCLDVEIALDSKFNPEGCVFRPIRSPEEYEREKAIDEMLIMTSVDKMMAAKLYDAGYRKVK